MAERLQTTPTARLAPTTLMPTGRIALLVPSARVPPAVSRHFVRAASGFAARARLDLQGVASSCSRAIFARPVAADGASGDERLIRCLSKGLSPAAAGVLSAAPWPPAEWQTWPEHFRSATAAAAESRPAFSASPSQAVATAGHGGLWVPLPRQCLRRRWTHSCQRLRVIACFSAQNFARGGTC